MFHSNPKQRNRAHNKKIHENPPNNNLPLQHNLPNPTINNPSLHGLR